MRTHLKNICLKVKRSVFPGPLPVQPWITGPLCTKHGGKAPTHFPRPSWATEYLKGFKHRILGPFSGTRVSVGAFQVALVVKNLSADAGDIRDTGLIPGLGRAPGGGHGNPLQFFLPGESHGPRSLAGYGP